MIITKDYLKSLNPCADRWKNYLTHYENWSGTVLEFLELENITVEDKFWVVLRKEIIPEKQFHLLTCDFAEMVLDIYEKDYPNDNRPRAAIETKRKWVNGEASGKELYAARIAARDAAWAAARSTSRAAAWAAARSTSRAAAWAAARAWGVAWDAAWGVARDATRAAQLRLVCEAVKQLEQGKKE